MKLPLFPLSSHILPAGRMALRIFEPRYVRMIKQACAQDSEFVICMLDNTEDSQRSNKILPVGTSCKVVDFDLLPDGLLGVTVEGQYCVSISETEVEPDGLRMGECTVKPDWTSNVDLEQLHPIDKRLKEIFERYPEVSSLYTHTHFDDPVWVIQRWIELLPVGAEQKQEFIAKANCQAVLRYLSQMIE